MYLWETELFDRYNGETETIDNYYADLWDDLYDDDDDADDVREIEKEWL